MCEIVDINKNATATQAAAPRCTRYAGERHSPINPRPVEIMSRAKKTYWHVIILAKYLVFYQVCTVRTRGYSAAAG